MAAKDTLPSERSSRDEIDAFLNAAARVPALSQVRGRLIFAIDATMSRQPSWDRAAEIQTEMFEVAQSIGGLAVQLVWFRGRGEFEASEWTVTPAALAERMRAVACRSGFTQLRRVLQHAADEARRTRIGALVYVGDCFEERHEAATKAAAALALRGVPAFMFHEGAARLAAAVAPGAGGSPAPAPGSDRTLDRRSMAELQGLLARLDFAPGAADGVAGRRTVAAIKLYQEFAGLPVDGKATVGLLHDVRDVSKTLGRTPRRTRQ